MSTLIDAKFKLVHFQVMEETYLKQKSTSKFLYEEDKSTKYFHVVLIKRVILNPYSQDKKLFGNGVRIKKRLWNS